MVFSYMTTYFASDFASKWRLVAFSKTLELIALEILEYLKHRYANPKNLKLPLTY